MYGCGIIGCGFIGVEARDSHLRAYKENPDCELGLTCDPDLDRARKYSGDGDTSNDCKLAIPVEGLDIVSVCTPPETHKDIVCDIAPYVKAIWCEKPIATSVRDAEDMVTVCENNKTLLVINHQREFMTPVFRFSRGSLNTGTHLFSLLQSMFQTLQFYEGRLYADGKEIILREVDSAFPVFEFDCTHNKDRMLPRVLEYIIECLGKPNGWKKTNAFKAIQSLKFCKEYELIKNENN